MSRKPLQIMGMSFILALALFFGAWGAVYAQDQPEQPEQPAAPGGTTIAMGNQGIFVPVADAEESFEITRVSKVSAGFAPADFLRDLIRIEATGDLGNNPFALTYVFFKLGAGDMRAYRNGDVGILFRGVDENTWNVCNSFVVGAAEDDSGSIACIVPRYNTIFGVAREDDGENGLFVEPVQPQAQPAEVEQEQQQ